VYAKFYDEEHADAALKGLDGRYDHLLDPLVVSQKHAKLDSLES
jgi:hypothetical protein